MNLNSLLERFGLQEGRLTETVNILFTMLVQESRGGKRNSSTYYHS